MLIWRKLDLLEFPSKQKCHKRGVHKKRSTADDKVQLNGEKFNVMAVTEHVHYPIKRKLHICFYLYIYTYLE